MLARPRSGRRRYAVAARKFYDYIKTQPGLAPGLYPQCVGARSGKITLGAEADSFYEYLPKVWLLLGNAKRRAQGAPSSDPRDFEDAWAMYDAALDGMETRLAARDGQGRLWLDELQWRGGAAFAREPAMEHLACFVPGWVALGARYQADPERAKRHLRFADELAETCWRFYADQPTGVATTGRTPSPSKRPFEKGDAGAPRKTSSLAPSSGRRRSRRSA